MVIFLLGVLIGMGFMWIVGYDTRAANKTLRAENSELVRRVGASDWSDKSVLEQLDSLERLAPTGTGMHSNQR